MRLFIPCSLIVLMLSGCGLIGVPSIKSGAVTVQGPKDAGKPAQLNTSEAGETIALPQGSRIVKSETEAIPATKDKPAQPAKTVTEIIPGGPTEWHKTESKVQADTGTVDTSVAVKKIEAAESRWLLFASIGCLVVGLVMKSMMPAWPALSNGLLIASPVAFAAWKLSEVPAWLWAVIVGAVALMALGYKRAEWDKNGDGIPDILQK